MPRVLSKQPYRLNYLTKNELDKYDEKNCLRCGGLLVKDRCDDLSSSGVLNIWIHRCVQCGDIIDSVILQHRCLSTIS